MHNLGDKAMLPFLVDMASLYEQFVAGWLSQNLPPALRLKVQEPLHIGGSNPLRFMIDLVLYDAASGLPKMVLDTKYKRTAKPAHSDIFQAVTYAEGKGCRQAVLIYPLPLATPLNETIGNIWLRSLTFAVDGNLDDAGHAFLQSLCTIL
jgi:5-methylcytosine-specific restriction enzyme subunit McrC